MRTFLVLLVLAPWIAAATTITTRDGRAYQGVEVIRHEPDGITIRHSAGLIKLFFAELPQEIRDQYNADPVAAREYQRRQAMAERDYRSAQERSQQAMQRASLHRDQDRTRRDAIQRSKIDVTGTVMQVLPSGVLLRDVHVVETYQVQDPASAGFRRHGWQTRQRLVKFPHSPILVAGPGVPSFDGARFSGTIYLSGRYQYADVLGSSRTVLRYATSLDLAARLAASD